MSPMPPAAIDAHRRSTALDGAVERWRHGRVEFRLLRSSLSWLVPVQSI